MKTTITNFRKGNLANTRLQLSTANVAELSSNTKQLDGLQLSDTKRGCLSSQTEELHDASQLQAIPDTGEIGQ
eukprot:5460978-Amphidinium_carterae.1